MPQRSVEATPIYLKLSKKIKGFQRVDLAIRNMMLTFGFSITTRSDMIYRTPNNYAEIWEIRIADPDKNKGKSGGFRLLIIYIKTEEAIFLDYVNERDDMNKPSIKKEYQAYLKTIKQSVRTTYSTVQ